eukprot:m.121804 g.121804  ORF g.121804 m.121804 type:complete len:3317 (+) comp28880_c0_seq1:403-10353(+)
MDSNTVFEVREWLGSESALHHLVCGRDVPQTSDTKVQTKPLLPLLALARFVTTLPATKQQQLALPASVLRTLSAPLAVQDDTGNCVDAVSLTQCLRDGQPVLVPVLLHGATLWLEPKGDTVRVALYSGQASVQAVVEHVDVLQSQPLAAADVEAALVTTESFAAQVCNLSSRVPLDAEHRGKHGKQEHTESRETPSNTYFLDFLLPCLQAASSIDDDTVSAIPQVMKKFHDEVRYSQGDLPWRRAPVWADTRAWLHHSMVEAHGSIVGTLQYKLLVLQFFLQAVWPAQQQRLLVPGSRSRIAAAHEFLAKLVRRTSKVRALLEACDKHDVTDARHRYTACVELLTQAEHLVATKITVSRKQTDAARQLPPPPSESATLEDALCHVRLSNSIHKYLQQLQSKSRLVHSNFGRLQPPSTASYQSLWDLESALWRAVLENTKPTFDAWSQMQAYNIQATTLYNDDPLGRSRHVLAGFAYIYLVDNHATACEPWIRSASIGVDVSLLSELLLPTYELLQVAHLLETKLQARATACSFEANSIALLDKMVELNGCEINPIVRKLKDADITAANAKFEEVIVLYKELTALEEAARGLTCTTEYGFSQTKGRMTDKHVNQRCKRCVTNKKIRDFSNRKVRPYFLVLPKKTREARQVIAECMLPPDVVRWRDALQYFQQEFLPFSRDGYSASSSQGQSWRKQLVLRGVAVHTGIERHVTLTTHGTFTSSTHYGHPISICSPLESFVKDPGGSLCISPRVSSRGREFLSAGMRLALPVKSSYSDVAFALKSSADLQARKSSFQNQAIANHALGALRRREGTAFATLREAPLLQYHHLAHALAQDSLSWGEAEVAQLLAQTCWESGPLPTARQGVEPWVRELHVALTGSGLSAALLERLEAIQSSHATNWAHPWLPTTLAIVTARLAMHAPHARLLEQARSLLARVRHMCCSWLGQVEQLMASSDTKQQATHRRTMAIICQGGLMTYAHLLDHTRGASALALPDPECWLTLLKCLFATRSALRAKPTWEGILTYQVTYLIGFVTPRVSQQLSQSPAIFSAAVDKLPPGDRPTRWAPGNQHWWCGESPSGPIVHFNLISGELLVNHQTAAGLPDTISQHNQFLRLFDSAAFDVVPHGPRHFTTTATPDAAIFRFETPTASSSSALSVELQLPGHCEWLQLLPHTLLTPHLPTLMMDKYSHWFSSKDKCVFFLPAQYTTTQALNVTETCMRLELGTQHLVDNPTALVLRLLLPNHSNTAGYWRALIRRVERPEFLHMWVNPAQKSIELELPRTQYSFTSTWQSPTIVMVKHHDGKVIAADQRLGTLHGLASGLVMAEKESWIVGSSESLSRSSVLLIPFVCDVACHSNNGTNLELLPAASDAEITLFEYTVASDKGCLVGPPLPQAWLYLSLLHALTAQTEVDSLTGQTGTDMALQLLQSPRTQWHEPYDEVCLALLGRLAALSPHRSFYPNEKVKVKMEKVTWPTEHGIVPWFANDAFAFLVHGLRTSNNQLLALIPQTSRSTPLTQDSPTTTSKQPNPRLSARAHVYHARLLGINSRCSPLISNATTHVSLQHSAKSGSACRRVAASIGRQWRLGLQDPAVARLTRLKTPLQPAQPLDQMLLAGAWSPSKRLDYSATDLLSLLVFFAEQPDASWQNNFLFCAALVFDPSCDAEPSLCWPQSTLIALAHRPCPGRFRLETLADELINSKYFCIGEEECVELLLERWRTPTWTRSAPRPPQPQPQRTSHRYGYAYGYGYGNEQETEEMENNRKLELQCYEQNLRQYDADKAVFDEAVAKDGKSFVRLVHDYVPQVLTVAADFDPCVLHEDLQCCPTVDDAAEAVDWSEFTSPLVPAMIKDIRSIMVVVLHSLRAGHVLDVLFKHICETLAALAPSPTSPGPLPWQASPISCRSPNKARNGGNMWYPPVQAMSEEEVASIVNWSELADLAPWPSEHQALIEPAPPPPALRLLGQDALSTALNQDLEQSFAALPGTASGNCNRSSSSASFERIMAQLVRLNQRLEGHVASVEAKLSTCLHAGIDQPLKQLWQAMGWQWHARPHLYLVHKNIQTMTALRPLLLLWLRLRTWCQKAERIARLGKQQQEAYYWRELMSAHHFDWQLSQLPAWLILEWESDVSMWPQQVLVAKAMMEPSSAQDHAVLQLNMGEGKSSVILPAIAAALADDDTPCLVRVIVPAPLLHSTADDLSRKLGGTLGRRILVLPCRRNFDLDADTLQHLLSLYQAGLDSKSVVVTTPEFVQSFQLKAVEFCERQPHSIEAQLAIELLQWLQCNVRDLLDEADEVLHIKRQLVYTMGTQQPPDGGALRWTTLQGILALVCEFAPALAQRFGPDVVECAPLRDLPHLQLPRLVDHPQLSEAFEWLCKRVLCAWLDGAIANHGIMLPTAMMTTVQKALVLAFITTPDVPEQDVNVDLESCEDTSATAAGGVVADFLLTELAKNAELKTVCTVLRGLFAYGVLKSALTRRWRVQFGVDPNRCNRHMAVPFAAKDKATENTEFGHTDLAVLLTLVSYYRSGLSESQFQETLTQLHALPNASNIFQGWIDFARDHKQPVPPNLRVYSSIVFDDTNQQRVLFDILAHNPRCIDFFLTSLVLKKEVKQFPFKLVATPWDLVSGQRTHALTGFSGTCDTQWQLPIGVKQVKLPELRGTNAKVLQALLREENSKCFPFSPLVTPNEVIAKITRHSATVLIDVGALVLQDNEMFARDWLDSVDSDEFLAVVFFQRNRKVVFQRGARGPQPLASTPYAHNLDRCLVYLDEEHTRGTDLRLKLGTRAAVTLGARLTRDKFVQACMRMRQLGEGHEVICFAGHDVYQQLQAQCPLPQDQTHVPTSAVLHWVLTNTHSTLEQGVIHWLQQGATSAQTEQHLLGPLAHSQLNTSSARSRMSQLVHQTDAASLMVSYAQPRRKLSMSKICAQLIKSLDVDSARVQAVQKHTDTYFQHCPQRYFNLLDEEQERELEHEIEEERQVEPPPRARPADADISQALRDAMASGMTNDGLIPLEQLVSNRVSRSASRIWAGYVRASPGYVQTIQPWERQQQSYSWYNTPVRSPSPKPASNDLKLFLRPVMWVLVLSDGTPLLLAPHEAQFVACALRAPLPPSSTSALVPTIALRLLAPRIFFRQDDCWADMRLSITSPHAPSAAPEPPLAALTELHLFAGSLFFTSLEQQQLALLQLGLCLRPHSDSEQQALADGRMLSDGFVPREHAHVAEGHSYPARVSTRSRVGSLRRFLTVTRNLEYHLPCTHLSLLLASYMANPAVRHQALDSSPSSSDGEVPTSDSGIVVKLLTVKHNTDQIDACDNDDPSSFSTCA